MRIAAVAFDMDGLMFDTERLIQISWEKIGTEMGFTNMGDFIYHTLGSNETTVRQMFFDHFGSEFPYDEFRTRERVYRQAIIDKDGFPIKPGLLELLQFLKENNIPMTVATSTSTHIAKEYLISENLLHFFVDVIGGDLVSHSKPDPEIYLRACEVMSVAPEQCLALEDSYNGIRAAYAGNLIPVMVPDLAPSTDEMKSIYHTCLPSLLNVIELIKQINQKSGV